MRIDKAIQQAKDWGMDALGISDHGSMAAHAKFYSSCKDAGIHPVLGMEAYITPNKAYKKADFERVTFVQNEKEEHAFAFMDAEELESDPKGWFLVEDIKPEKLFKQIMTECKEGFLSTVVESTLLPGQPRPKTKAAWTKLLNAYIKDQQNIGRGLYIQADATLQEHFSWFPRMGHLLLIAKNNEGYQNLLQLNMIGQLEGFYAKPRVDFEDIKKYGKGIVATTACLGSLTSQLIRDGYLEEAKAEIQRLVDCFDEVFLEIQPSRQPEQWVVNNQLIAWSEELNLPLIATSDVHMMSRDELEIHATLTNIGKGGSKQKSEEDQDISVYDSAYFMHPQEMLDNGIPQIALQNAYDLSHRCQVDFLDDKRTKFPEFEVPPGHTFDSYLELLSEQGLFNLFLTKDYPMDYGLYEQRIRYELDIISKKGLSAYFVIVWDYINWSRENGIFIGPGRGSAAGSLVCFVIGITNINPLRYDLLFERGHTCAR